ncbi:universal stress protein [Nocardiopsis sp. CNT312]|uniref:universal stress protein n=1 Tax=Nocardiopsis sp. CNT312 TaxID=1137268 RepID=UPI00048FECDD|nr:universal stress protein [Nocardiopsis sp. CNT312]
MAKQTEHHPHVVVGIDGSDNSNAALEWAAVEADRRGVPLTLVYALGMPLIVTAYGRPVRFQPTQEISDQADQVMTRAVKRAQEIAPSVEIKTMTDLEEAPLAIIRHCHPHDLIVVGTRGMGSVASVFAGSVSVRLAAHAPCPVVAVPAAVGGSPKTTALDRVVVGVDGSKHARRALGLAVDLVKEGSGELVVVNSWEVVFPHDPVALTAAGYQRQDEVLDRESESMVAELIADVIDAQGDEAGVPVSVIRTPKSPTDALLDAAEDADAIVVGSRGRGSVLGLLLGSVSQSVLHRSKVPVVILPKHADEE